MPLLHENIYPAQFYGFGPQTVSLSAVERSGYIFAVNASQFDLILRFPLSGREATVPAYTSRAVAICQETAFTWDVIELMNTLAPPTNYIRFEWLPYSDGVRSTSIQPLARQSFIGNEVAVNTVDYGKLFPDNPTINQPFYNTFYGEYFIYTGTAWVTVENYPAPMIYNRTLPVADANTNSIIIGYGFFPQFNGQLLVNLQYLFFYTGTTVGNSWTVAYTPFGTAGNPAPGGAQTVAIVSDGTNNFWGATSSYDVQSNVNTPVGFNVSIQKNTAHAGSLYIVPRLTYKKQVTS